MSRSPDLISMARRRWVRGAALAPSVLVPGLARVTGPLGLLAGTMPAWGVASAAPAAPRLLLVFLRGGYDATSLLVPLGSRFYQEARPTLAIAPPSADPRSAAPLDADWGLHPALRASLWPMYQAGQVVFIPFAGTPDLSRSHFETQDSIEQGLDGSGTKGLGSGFLHRLADALGAGETTAAFTDQQPLVMRGTPVLANVSVRGGGSTALSDRERRLISAMYAGRPQEDEVREGFATQRELREQAQEMQAANRQAIGTRGFEGVARRIARLMQERYRIGFIDVGGWDTHVAQGGRPALWRPGSRNWGADWRPSPRNQARSGRTRSWWSSASSGGPSARTATAAPIMATGRSTGSWGAGCAVGGSSASRWRSSAVACSRTAICRCSMTIGRCWGACLRASMVWIRARWRASSPVRDRPGTSD